MNTLKEFEKERKNWNMIVKENKSESKWKKN